MTAHLPDELVEDEIAAICERYRIGTEEARLLFEEYVQRRPDLLRDILPKVPGGDITRLKAYKTLLKGARKHIYYHLRQYQPHKDTSAQLRCQFADLLAASAPPQEIRKVIQQLLRTHVSTNERLEYYRDFYATLFDLIEPPRTLVDVGCGIHPLSYPYGQPACADFFPPSPGVRPERYVAIDKQAEVIETLQVFAPLAVSTELIPVFADIADVDWKAYVQKDGMRFDLAVMLKLIPVLRRQQKHLLPKLARIPARHILMTATTEAMTRKQNIRKREERALQEFIELTGRQVAAEFQVGHEFGFLLR